MNESLTNHTDLQLRLAYSETWLDELDKEMPVHSKKREKVFKLKERNELFNLKLKQTVFHDKALFWGSKKTSFLTLDEIDVDESKRASGTAMYGWAALQISLSDKQ